MSVLSIYLGLFQFLSALFCGFQCVDFHLSCLIYSQMFHFLWWYHKCYIVHRNKIYFHIQILHPAKLLSLFISSSGFFTDSIEFSKLDNHVAFEKIVSLLPFPYRYSFILPFYIAVFLIALARISSIMLTRSGKADITVSILILEENHSVFHD